MNEVFIVVSGFNQSSVRPVGVFTCASDAAWHVDACKNGGQFAAMYQAYVHDSALLGQGQNFYTFTSNGKCYKVPLGSEYDVVASNEDEARSVYHAHGADPLGSYAAVREYRDIE